MCAALPALGVLSTCRVTYADTPIHPYADTIFILRQPGRFQNLLRVGFVDTLGS